MIVDTSAIVAFLRGEPGADAIEAVLDGTPELRMSAFTALECRTVLHLRFGPRTAADFDLLLARAEIEVRPFDGEPSELAFHAYRRFGKGTGHPARLNLGGCAAYALATSLAEPLLCKGDDFPRTDVRVVALRDPDGT